MSRPTRQSESIERTRHLRKAFVANARFSHVDSVAVGPADSIETRSVVLQLTEEGTRRLERSVRVEPAVEFAAVLDGEVISRNG